jgi:hypothetical protein
MIDYKIDEISPNNFRGSAHENGLVIAYGLYNIKNDSANASGIGFSHSEKNINPDIIKNLIEHALLHLSSLGISHLVSLPTKNIALLVVFATYFENAIFYNKNGVLSRDKILDLPYVENNFHCMQSNTQSSISVILPVPK